MRTALRSGHGPQLGVAAEPREGAVESQGLGPSALAELLRPCRPPVPTPPAEPSAFRGAGGEQGLDPPLVLRARGLKNLGAAPGGAERPGGAEDKVHPPIPLQQRAPATGAAPHGESSAKGCGF